MVDSVLLKGFLSKSKLDQALKELKVIKISSYDTANLLINSGGGDAVATVDFINRCGRIGINLQIKIYKAKSAAALIATLLGSYREMKDGINLGLHLSEARIQRHDCDQKGVLDERIQRGLDNFDGALIEVMKSFGIFEPNKEILLAGDWVNLPAHTCKDRGIVHRLF